MPEEERSPSGQGPCFPSFAPWWPSGPGIVPPLLTSDCLPAAVSLTVTTDAALVSKCMPFRVILCQSIIMICPSLAVVFQLYSSVTMFLTLHPGYKHSSSPLSQRISKLSWVPGCAQFQVHFLCHNTCLYGFALGHFIPSSHSLLVLSLCLLLKQLGYEDPG